MHNLAEAVYHEWPISTYFPWPLAMHNQLVGIDSWVYSQQAAHRRPSRAVNELLRVNERSE